MQWVLIFILINSHNPDAATVIDNTHFYARETDCWFHAGIEKAKIEREFELTHDKVGATCIKAKKGD